MHKSFKFQIKIRFPGLIIQLKFKNSGNAILEVYAPQIRAAALTLLN